MEVVSGRTFSAEETVYKGSEAGVGGERKQRRLEWNPRSERECVEEEAGVVGGG